MIKDRAGRVADTTPPDTPQVRPTPEWTRGQVRIVDIERDLGQARLRPQYLDDIQRAKSLGMHGASARRQQRNDLRRWSQVDDLLFNEWCKLSTRHEEGQCPVLKVVYSHEGEFNGDAIRIETILLDVVREARKRDFSGSRIRSGL
jgi:hypothetical protein